MRGRASRGLFAALAFISVAAPAADGDTLTGDWNGLRPALAERGVRLEAGYTTEVIRNAAGGLRTGTARTGLLEFQALVDGARAFGWPDTRLRLHLVAAHGDDPGALVGDAQGVSNISAGRRARVFEAWLQRSFPEARVSVLAGRFDLNAEFYHLQTANLFLHSSFGIGPEFGQSGLGGPSIYPETAFGARAEYRPDPWVFRAALLNGVPARTPRTGGGDTGWRRTGDGALLVAEAALVLPERITTDERARARRQRIGRAALDIDQDSKLALGAWRYTARYPDLVHIDAAGLALQRHGTSGAYVLAEQVLHRDARNASRRLRVFAKGGVADERVNRFGRFLGAGATFVGPFDGRPDDELGIAFASARNGAHFLDSERAAGRAVTTSELAWELTWLFQLRPWLALQPSLTRVRDPGTRPATPDARVLMLRLEIAL